VKRVAGIVVAGASTTALALVVSRTHDGLLGAAGFLFALFIPTVSLGLLLSAATDVWFERVDRRLRAGEPPAERRSFRLPFLRRSCRSCSATMTQLDFLWICDRCDRILARD
jgi:hypothetical protein